MRVAHPSTPAIERWLERIPHYDRFVTVEELYAKARQVARRHPDVATLSEVGASTDGQPIPMLTVGDGSQRIMLVACPHPNEPVGAMLVHFLMDELIAAPELREGRTWFLLPCVDPDGMRLNEGWFGGPFTLRNYARHFFRPRSEEQVEWTFPVEYKTYRFDRPLPETRALMTAIGQARPHVMYSLHNAGFGGVYYYLSRHLPAAYETLHQVPTQRGLTLSLGEPEMPWAVELYPAVYAVPRSTDAYDYYQRFGTGDPARYMTGGASSFEYASTVSAPLVLVTEVPYFQSPKVADTSTIGRSRRDVILAGVERGKSVLQVVQRFLDETRPAMDVDTRLWRAVSSFTESGLKALESQARWAIEGDGMDRPATVAQEADALYVSLFYRVLVASMLRRAFDERLRSAQAPRGGDRQLILEAMRELESHLERWTTEIEANLPYEPIPIRTLVQVQWGALLAVLSAMEGEGTAVA